MANIQERRDKNGKLISFSIRVHRGRGPDGKQLKPYIETFAVQPGWSEKTARRKAEQYAAVFEDRCKQGLASDTRITLRGYTDYVIALKEARGAKHSTICSYRNLTRRIYAEIGHIKLRELRPDHLNDFYTKLSKRGERLHTRAVPKPALQKTMLQQKLSKAELARRANVGVCTVDSACAGNPILVNRAEVIAAALKVNCKELFVLKQDDRPLSGKTVREYHRLIATILRQAVKEGLIPYNVADRAQPPAYSRKAVNYFQPDEVLAISEAAESEPIKWQTMLLLFLVSGVRRSELAGLKWSCVDWEKQGIHINNCIYYRADVGIYEDKPKTKNSLRFIGLPEESMAELKRYKDWQDREKERLDDLWQDNDYVFPGTLGSPMHPDSITRWCARFSERHNLPHINPHVFRHTMASLLYFNHADPISISNRLGHSHVSTTQDIYAHLIEEADKKNADILGDVLFPKTSG